MFTITVACAYHLYKPNAIRISEREKAHKKTREDLLAEQARLEQQAVKMHNLRNHVTCCN